MRINSSFDINLSYLSDNVDLIRQASASEMITMVKANAYGHGLLEISKFLVLEKKIKTLGVGSLGEALYLRQNFSDAKYEIIVFSDFNLSDKWSQEIIRDYDIDIVLSSLDLLKTFLENKDFEFKKLYLKFDSGMHRLGIAPSEIEQVLSLLKGSGRKSIHHLMAHFSSSYLPSKKTDHTDLQLKTFLKIKKELESFFDIEETSISNSGAIEQKIGLDFSHIRPGLMLYGPASYPHSKLDGKTKLISSLRTYILKKRNISKGDPIGYGRSICPENGVVVYLPLGYGDGLLTHMSGLKLNVNNVSCKVLGRVNMDLICLLIEKKDADLFKVNEEIYLWKNDNDVLQSIYFHCKTNPYHILTSVSGRVPKRYLK